MTAVRVVTVLRVGLCCTSDEHELRAAVATVGGEVTWVVRDVAALGEAFGADRTDLVLVRHGDRIDAARATEAVGRDVPVVVAVDDAARAADLFSVLARGRVEVAGLARAASNGLGDVASVLRHHARPRSVAPPPRRDATPILTLAASAGGPEALAAVLRDLDASTVARTLIAQHIDPPFVVGLAEWLARASFRRVAVADEGTQLTTEVTLVVRSERQPTLSADCAIRYVAPSPGQTFHPSIDVLWASLARTHTRGVAVLLTGMGNDGARGLLALREAGWTTIAQDASSSRIFGMPREAARLGAAESILPLDRIGRAASLALGRSGMRASPQ